MLRTGVRVGTYQVIMIGHFAGVTDLHPPGIPYPRVRYIPVPSDLVAGVDDYRSLGHGVGQHAGDVPNGSGLADARTAQKQDVAPLGEEGAEEGVSSELQKLLGMRSSGMQNGNQMELRTMGLI